MTVFVLLESGQHSPVAILESPEIPSLLPKDAVEKMYITKQSYGHREIVGEWTSKMFGTIFTLVAYRIL